MGFYSEVVLPVLVFIVSPILALMLLATGVDYYFIRDYKIGIFSSDGKLVYEGPRACIRISSSGASTTLEVYGGWMCMFPKEVYVGLYTVQTAKMRK